MKPAFQLTSRGRGVRSVGILAAAIAGALLPPLALADDGLQEIIVTAQRRSERIHDVPIAITAITSEDLDTRGIRQAGDIAAAVPNLLLNSPYGPEAQPTFTLRGVTTQDFSQNQSSPIAMYVDDVYRSVGALQALQIYDLDRVEVLRGPQGTLYGKNATGGAVSFISKNPSLTEEDGYVTAGLGNYSSQLVHAAVGAPIIDNELGWRAAILYEKRDGWTKSIVPGVEPLNGVDALAGRFTLLAKPNDQLTVTFKLAVSRSGGTPYGAHALNNDPTVTGFSGNIDWFSNGAKYAVHKDIRSDDVSLKLDWEMADHLTLTSVTGYDFGRWYELSDDGGLGLDDSGAPIRLDDPNTYASSVTSFSQELRLASRDTGALNWLAGLYYGRDVVHANVQFHFFDAYPGSFFPNPDGDPLYGFDEFNNFDQTRDSRAVFLNANYAVTPEITIRAGVRYTKDKITIKNFYALEGGLDGPPTGLGPNSGTTLWTQTIPTLPGTYTDFHAGTNPLGPVAPEFGQDNNNVSAMVDVDWKPSEDVLAYLKFSQGYRGAAFNGQAFNAPAELNFAAPEKLNSYELGLKAQFWNRHADLNVSVFHYDYRNQQFLDTFALPGGGTGFHTVNAPKSKIDGGEVEFRARPTADVEISAGLGILNSKYVDLFLHGVSRSGNKLIQAPDATANVDLNWRFVHLGEGDLRLDVNANYTGKQYFDALNTERIAQGAYSLENARVSFDSSGKHGFSVGVWIKNLTNEKYLAYGLAQRNPEDGGLGFDYALVGEPRTFGIDATYRF